jgi:Flp pilus assembly protein TadG
MATVRNIGNMTIRSKTPEFLEWLKTYWFIIIALFAGSVAWGQTINKVQTLEDAVKSNAEVHAQVNTLQAGQERLDERTKAMIEAQSKADSLAKERFDNQQELLKQIIQNQNNRKTK